VRLSESIDIQPTNYLSVVMKQRSYNNNNKKKKNETSTVQLWSFFFCMSLATQCIHAFMFDANSHPPRWQSKMLRRGLSAKVSLRHVYSHLTFSTMLTPFSLNSSKGSDNEQLPRVSIEYCTGCKWMLRAAWISQELLTTFQDELHSVSLVPSKPPSPAGTFLITLNGNIVIWNRKDEGRFPEAKEVKQRIRDAIRPEKSLGHSDTDERKASREYEQVDMSNDSVTEASKNNTVSVEDQDSQSPVTIVSFEETVQYTSSSSSITSTSIIEEKCEECNDERKNMVLEMQMKFKDLDDDDTMEMRRYFGVW
jgi:selenoprotein W-related protein